jgi:hypothetical protein
MAVCVEWSVEARTAAVAPSLATPRCGLRQGEKTQSLVLVIALLLMIHVVLLLVVVGSAVDVVTEQSCGMGSRCTRRCTSSLVPQTTAQRVDV